MLRVLERIRPSEEEERRLQEISKDLVRAIEERTSRVDKRIYARLLGSTSRGTWLRDEKDMDIFVFFPQGYSKKALEKVVTDVGAEILENPEKRYAEHPYIRGTYMDFEVEIVPCYSVDSAQNIMSAVDRTPFHNAFIKKHIEGKEDGVRLLKRFMKGIGVYGAEARVQGFSGYLCELLVVRFGSFEGVLEAASTWRPGQVVTLQGGPDLEVIREKFSSPLVFIDPVDDNRNVASALSLDNFSRFVYASKRYLKRPGEEFFFPPEVRVEKDTLMDLARVRGTDLLGILFEVPDIVDDILYPQLRKGLSVLENLLDFHGFEALRADFIVADRALFLFELRAAELPGGRLHMGPPVNTEHEERFLDKYRDNPRALTRPFIQDGRWYVVLKRKFTRVGELLTKYLSKRDLTRRGMPKYIAESIEEKGMEIVSGDSLFQEGFLPGLKDVLDPEFPWDR